MRPYSYHVAATLIAGVSVFAIWLRVGGDIHQSKAFFSSDDPEALASLEDIIIPDSFQPEEPQPAEEPIAENPEETPIAEEEPIIEEPAAEEPALPAEEPGAEEPGTDVTIEPEEPIAEVPIVEVPVEETPATESPATEEPAPVEEPVTEPEVPAEETPIVEELPPTILPAYTESRSQLAMATNMADWLYTLRPSADYVEITRAREDMKTSLIALSDEVEKENGGDAAMERTLLCNAFLALDTLQFEFAIGSDATQPEVDKANQDAVDAMDTQITLVRQSWESVNATALSCTQ